MTREQRRKEPSQRQQQPLPFGLSQTAPEQRESADDDADAGAAAATKHTTMMSLTRNKQPRLTDCLPPPKTTVSSRPRTRCSFCPTPHQPRVPAAGMRLNTGMVGGQY